MTAALVTRPREEARKLADALAARGVRALIEPLIEVHYLDQPLDLAGVQAVLCTSANGARALARAVSERQVPIFAVGDATASRARAEGFTEVASAAGDAGHLVLLAAARLRPERGLVLHAAGSRVAGNVAGELAARGFTVERRVLYEASPAAALSREAQTALRKGVLDAALFFSPRTGAIFVKLVGAAGIADSCARLGAVSISRAADDAVAPLAWRKRAVASQPNQLALLEALDIVLENGFEPGNERK